MRHLLHHRHQALREVLEVKVEKERAKVVAVRAVKEREVDKMYARSAY